MTGTADLPVVVSSDQACPVRMQIDVAVTSAARDDIIFIIYSILNQQLVCYLRDVQRTLHLFFRIDKKYPVCFFTCFIQGLQLPLAGGAVGAFRWTISHQPVLSFHE